MTAIELAPLERLTRRAFGEGPVMIEPMPGGASTRSFFRVRHEGGRGVGMFVPDATRSDEIDKVSAAQTRWPFLEVRDLLGAHGVRVPRLLGEATAEGFILVEDLGDETLAARLEARPGQKRELYEIAVRDLAHAQRELRTLPAGCVVTTRAFDEDLLRWELEHFVEWAVDARDIPLTVEDRALFADISGRVASRIASWPRGFVHRDYQSRNLMVRGPTDEPELVWIDFQDALLGPRVYDLVALLNDSYQTFTRDFVEDRLREYAELVEADAHAIVREFDVVTVQRKLKDAGRFVFIEREKGNPSFLQYVEPTIAKARASLARLADDPDLAKLAEVLERTLGS